MGRIAVYEGIASFATAGADILSDPTIDAALIKGLDTEAQAVNEAIRANLAPPFHEQEGSQELADIFIDAVPEVKQLDEVVRQWWEEQSSVAGYMFEPRLRNAWVRHDAIKPHFDILSDEWPIDGPLTFSLRLDTLAENLRIFYALRHNDLMSLSQSDNILAIIKNQQSIFQRFRKSQGAGMNTVTQRPGELVMFMNHPQPTLHGVDTVNTRSFIGSYLIDPPNLCVEAY